MNRRCDHVGKFGRCTRAAKWTWEDDSMKLHHVCTQHRNIIVPQGGYVIPAIPKCYANIRDITCECDKYQCTFTKKETTKKGVLVNKGKGICPTA
jgi:hypothetical protein